MPVIMEHKELNPELSKYLVYFGGIYDNFGSSSPGLALLIGKPLHNPVEESIDFKFNNPVSESVKTHVSGKLMSYSFFKKSDVKIEDIVQKLKSGMILGMADQEKYVRGEVRQALAEFLSKGRTRPFGNDATEDEMQYIQISDFITFSGISAQYKIFTNNEGHKFNTKIPLFSTNLQNCPNQSNSSYLAEFRGYNLQQIGDYYHKINSSDDFKAVKKEKAEKDRVNIVENLKKVLKMDLLY